MGPSAILRLLAVCALLPPPASSEPGPRLARVRLPDGPAAVLGPHQVLAWTSGATLEARPPPSWRRLRGPIGTVCVTGDDRIGKSTLLTLWVRRIAGAAGRTFAFKHSRSLKSQTQGVWSAVVPSEASGLQYHLNLCDSQGLKQVSEIEQWRLFSANVLTPQVLVYMLFNVVQNDQIRDLAEMAHQFQQMSTESFERFGRVLSPHLILVVRDASGLRGTGALSEHLEEVLHSPGRETEKALIRRVFRTREAWRLSELPTEAQEAVRSDFDADGGHLGDNLDEGAGAAWNASALPRASEPWRRSGEAVLQRALVALDEQLLDLPQGGPELAEWHRSIAATVNSHEGRGLGRLIGHSELLQRGHHRRSFLRMWAARVLAALATGFVVFALGNCVGRWIDRTMWCMWLVLCVFYLGTSQLVTMPLGVFGSSYCDAFSPSAGRGALLLGGDLLLRGACREASPYTASVLLAIALGVMSYPLVKSQLAAAARHIPMFPRALRVPALAFGAVLAGFVVTIWDESVDDWTSDLDDDGWPGVPTMASTVLLVVAAGSGVRLCLALKHNLACSQASKFGLQLHRYVAARVDEVRELEQSAEWREHYRRYCQGDALWRYRRTSVWHLTACCGQACALLCWAWMVHPHFDLLLGIGTAANIVGVFCRGAWAFFLWLRSWRSHRQNPVEEWFEQLDDASSDDGEEAEDAQATCESCEQALDLPETEPDRLRRQSLEAVRSAQERFTTRAKWWQLER